ncbi:coiled-coil domain-containing protein 191 [Sitophilus oryzae]|uniref:Coiled-coil domain-containing protein 191 n=1 Tax=Sitophilus oryzae TaxID=7048 RepID=A0A6J2Y4W7_SITOR|nr:coiled-coil domain-containing protein 191 [Sitophilus oryzae]
MEFKDISHSLSPCKNIILEAKRTLICENIEAFANTVLESPLFKNLTTVEKTPLNIIDSSEESEVLNRNSSTSSSLDNSVLSIKEEDLPPERALLKIYFHKWKNNIKQKSTDKPTLEKFITNLKHYQKKSVAKVKSKKETKQISSPHSNFQNRYKAQTFIINSQKAKLEEQEKIISELKLGIIREDLLKSIENTKFQIKNIFANCSETLLKKAPLVKSSEERDQIMISSQKAPKFVQHMEHRAIERAKYRDMILERKKVLEEARQRLLEEAIEKKRVLEEEERKKNLELINEQRRKDLELRKTRQKNREIFEQKLKKAEHFYNCLLVKQCFQKLISNYHNSLYNHSLATSHYLHKEKLKAFKGWMGYVESKYEIKYQIADEHKNYKLLRHSFNIWKEFKLDCMRSRQVAEDIYDFRLTNRVFVHWYRYVCKQIMIEYKKMNIAKEHNNRRMLFHYFYLWKSLPAVLQLEKARDERKRKWREKVWEVLPDFKPPEPL